MQSKSVQVWEDVAALYRRDCGELFAQGLTARHVGELIAGEVQEAVRAGRAPKISEHLTTIVTTQRQIIRLATRIELQANTLVSLRSRLPVVTLVMPSNAGLVGVRRHV